MNDRMSKIVWCAFISLSCAACAGRGAPAQPGLPSSFLSGQNYSYAVYGRGSNLLHSPIEHLRRTLERQGANESENTGDGISDIFVICHGWNFTLEESARLYENYLLSAQRAVDHIQQNGGEDFRPYFIFITWNSVTRPLTGAIESISPFRIGYVATLTRIIDTLAFHIPSAWGETQNAFEMAMGNPNRTFFDPAKYAETESGESEYDLEVARAVSRSATRPFTGYQTPVSVLLDEIMRLRKSNGVDAPKFRLHTVGHSYGAKVVSLASFDAVSRIRLAIDPVMDSTGPDVALLDSMVLINPAMRVGEMFLPVETPVTESSWNPVEWVTPGDENYATPDGLFAATARAIDKKAIIYSRQDSATGWLFALSQIVVDNESLAQMQAGEATSSRGDNQINTLQETMLIPFRFARVLVTTVLKDLVAFVLEPPRALVNLRKSSGVGDFALRFVGIPFTPISSQRAIGNSGFAEVGEQAFRQTFAIWKDESTTAYLLESAQHDESRFKCASAQIGLGVPLQSSVYNLYDADSVYTGRANGKLDKPFLKDAINFVALPGAHGDIRSYAEVDGVSKRVRTFNFIYNLTRSEPDAPTPDCNDG